MTIAISFVSSKDNHEEHATLSKSDNIEFMINDKTDEVIEKLFASLNRYQIEMKPTIKSSDFVFDCVQLLYYKCHKIFSWI